MATQQLQPLEREKKQDGATPGRRRTALVIAAVALVAIGWLSTRLIDSPSPEDRPRPRTAGATPLQSTTPDVSWMDFAGLDLPVSRTAGPTHTAENRASGFSHTPTGAAYAAVHLLVRTFPFAGPAVFTPTIAERVVGPDAATLARLTTEAYQQLGPAAGAKDGAPIRSEGGWVAGYQLDHSTNTQNTDTGADTEARVVRVLIRQVGEAGADGFTEYTVHLTWRNSDWRLVAPAWGDWRASARAMTSADPARYTSYDPTGRP